ncbi:MAG TPA: hypothetical protein VGY53_12445 [Isosphaeraceae bacterium]|nr:hypothetical protein [Isosphaeraceae bacterium]
MICAYCEKPLTCDSCQVLYKPLTAEQYEKVSEGDEAVFCPECEQILVCHWCKTPYDGRADDDAEAPMDPGAVSEI